MIIQWPTVCRRLGFAFLSGLVLLAAACQKNEAELTQLRQEHAELEQLRAQVQQLQQAQVSEAEVARLRKENEEVHRLRNEIRQVREEMKTLQVQASKAPVVNPQVANENAKLKAELEGLKQTTAAQGALTGCQASLRQVAGAVQQWAAQHQRAPGSPISPADLLDVAKLIPGGRIPACPAGGAYGILVVGANPQCSIPGHVLQ